MTKINLPGRHQRRDIITNKPRIRHVPDVRGKVNRRRNRLPAVIVVSDRLDPIAALRIFLRHSNPRIISEYCFHPLAFVHPVEHHRRLPALVRHGPPGNPHPLVVVIGIGLGRCGNDDAGRGGLIICDRVLRAPGPEAAERVDGGYERVFDLGAGKKYKHEDEQEQYQGS
ncbi:MAG: hypothetical protein A4E28_00470 [Methanocella sp. PtaU1.Bin125]|nr:MAG: hypothetical protein A4E28_00470 [Methanocella sp. PtaU1.Bin125]